MKLALLALALTCVVSAAPMLLTDPIPVTGGGHFAWSYPGDAGYTLRVTGSDGINEVAFSSYGGYGGAYRDTMDTLWGRIAPGIGYGMINGLFSQFATFSVGRGAGYLNLFDAQEVLLASAPLISMMAVSNYVESKWERSGDIVVFMPEPMPEPSTLTLIFGGLLALLRRRSRDSEYQRIRTAMGVPTDYAMRSEDLDMALRHEANSGEFPEFVGLPNRDITAEA